MIKAPKATRAGADQTGAVPTAATKPSKSKTAARATASKDTSPAKPAPNRRKTKAPSPTATPATKTAISTPSPKPPRQTKAALLRARLGAPGGVSLAALMQATGWQAHTLRAALTGLRKAGISITRRREGDDTIYAIEPEPASPALEADGGAAEEIATGPDDAQDSMNVPVPAPALVASHTVQSDTTPAPEPTA